MTPHTNSIVFGTETSLVDAIARTAFKAVDALRRRRLYNQIIRELSALAPHELTDIGISPWQIRETALKGAYGDRV